MPPASDPTATTWIEALDDAAPLRAVFGSQALSSNRVELLSLMVDRDGPTVTLGVELTDFPAVPPAKWVGCNTVHADIVFMAVEEFDVTGFARQMTVELDVQRSRDGRQVGRAGPPRQPRTMARMADVVLVREAGTQSACAGARLGLP